MKRVIVIGGGISGLVVAYRLSRSAACQEGKLEIHICEASDQFGGVIQTKKQNGFLMEEGPDSFITSKPGAIQLCCELGLDKDFMETNPDVQQSFILSRSRLIPVPRGFYLMAPTRVGEALKVPLLSFSGRIRMGCEFFIPPKPKKGDESLASFVSRRFGRETLERIAEPMIAGIYTADPEELSLEATFPHFLKMEQEHGSVIKALMKQKDAATNNASGPRYSLFVTLKEGLHSLVSRLIKQMPQVNFHPSAKLVALETKPSFKALFGNGKVLEGDMVCLAIPAPSAARLLNHAFNEIATKLKKIPYTSVATINLAFNKKSISHPLNGMGYVVPSVENKKIVGCTFSSIKFPGRSENSQIVLLRAFLGGKASRGLWELSDEEIINIVSNEIKKQLGINDEPISAKMNRWPEAIPQYCVGHRRLVSEIFETLVTMRGLYLTGNAYGGTGIPDCIQHASDVARQILSDIQRNN